MQFTFAELLRGFRQRASLNQATLARALDMHLNTVSAWERGLYLPKDPEIILRLAEELTLAPAETNQLLRAAEFPSISTTPDPPSARHQLRPPIADFVGRASATEHLVATLRAALAQGGTVIGGVEGMGGVGKTELAYRVAHTLSDSFPDAQILLDLHGTRVPPLTAAQALQIVIRVFTPEAKLPDDIEALQALYRSALHGQRVLILADDARDAAQVEPLIPPLGCALLLTSRVRFTLPGVAAIHLEPLDADESVTLLRRICDCLSLADAQALALACGRLPLALRISSGILRNDLALPVAAYLQQLADERQRLRHLRDPDDRGLDVEAALALSYTQLAGATQQVFRQLGVLVADFAAELAQRMLEAPAEVDVTALLRQLLRRNLIVYDAAYARWRLHDLVRDLARRYLETAAEWDAAMWRYAQATAAIVQEIQAQYQAGGEGTMAALSRFDADRPHIGAAWQWAASHAGSADGDALLVALACATTDIGPLRYDLRRERIPQLELALSAAQRLLDHSAEGLLLTQLGITYRGLGEAARALPYYEQGLDIARSQGDQLYEGRRLNNLGMAYLDLGELRRAIACFEPSLRIARALGEQCLEGILLNNLGLAYLHLGELPRAIASLEQALRIAQEMGKRPEEAIRLCNLGIVYLDQGELPRAISSFERSIAITREMGHRLGEGIVGSELGLAYLAQGDAERALESCQGALAIVREVGNRHREGMALYYLGYIYARLEQVAEASSAFVEASAIFAEVGNRKGAAECDWHYGLFLAGQGERERALPLLRAAVAYEQEIGHAKAAEHAALIAQLEAGEELPQAVVPSNAQRSAGSNEEIRTPIPSEP